IASLLLFWPGIAEYDTIVQYREVASGRYTDWHPPIMARLWSLFAFAGPSSAPLLVLQMTGYWLGLGLIGRSLENERKALALLAIGASPLLLAWLAVVVKDSQLVGALTLATGVISVYRLRGRPVPAPALAMAILCLAYATLVRANGAFSTVPLAMLLAPRPRNELVRVAVMIMAIPVILLVSQPVNHVLLGARDSRVRSSQPIYDLAAIAVRTGDPSTGLVPQSIRTLEAHHCVKPLFWDPLGENAACAAVIRPWDRAPLTELYREFARALAAHPAAYIAHRLAHLNSTERWLVPPHWPLAAPPARSEPNDLGFPNPSPMATQWQGIAAWMTDAPLAWPILWIVAAIWGLWNAWRRPSGGRRDIAIALFLSALFQEASFTLISISSDLRYHLWVMLATALGWVMMWRSGVSIRATRLALMTMAFVLLSGGVARVTLTPPPAHYHDLMN
ncbi:MAG TPA: hypothetical protein VF442_02830, partial [Sphingobium sp.]